MRTINNDQFLASYTNSKFSTSLNLNHNSSYNQFENGNFQLEINNSVVKNFPENNGNFFGNPDDMATIVATSSAAETTAAVLKAFANATSSLTVISPPFVNINNSSCTNNQTNGNLLTNNLSSYTNNGFNGLVSSSTK